MSKIRHISVWMVIKLTGIKTAPFDSLKLVLPAYLVEIEENCASMTPYQIKIQR